MKSLHRPDLLGWSRFDEKRNVDFCGVAWIRPGGNVLIDGNPGGPTSVPRCHDRHRSGA